jgi:cysteine-rich repeat protein
LKTSAIASVLLIAAPEIASAAPGDLLVGGTGNIWKFNNGGAINTTFASVGGAAIRGLCIGPAAAIYAGTAQGQVVDVTAGGNVSVATPHATVPGQISSLACDATHVYALTTQQQLFDVTSGGAASTPYAYNFSGIPLFPGDAFYGPAGELFVAVGSGVVNAAAGGDMSSASYFVDTMGQDYLLSGSTLGNTIFAIGLYSNLYDITAGGTLAAPIVSGLTPGMPVRVLASPPGVFVLDSQGSMIILVSNGAAVPFAQGNPGLAAMAYVPLCGDGFVHIGESCDGNGNGNGGATAQCDSDCTAASCGDGTINASAGESCDGNGNGVGGETASCDTDCSAASCGDGLLNVTAGESCDGNGNGVGGETASCDTDCSAASCGDGLLNATAGESCDGNGNGIGGETASCNADCSAAGCGDGVLNLTAGEACDDGNSDEGDGCDASCAIEGAGQGGGGQGGSGQGGGEGGGSPEGGMGGDAPALCSPGQQIACACPGGDQGAQACNAEGSGYDVCACPEVETPTATDSGCSWSGASLPNPLASWAWLVAAIAIGARRRRRDTTPLPSTPP